MNFVENFTSKEDMTAVSNNPIRRKSSYKDMDDPVGVDSFKSFSKIGKENDVTIIRAVQKVLNFQVGRPLMPDKSWYKQLYL